MLAPDPDAALTVPGSGAVRQTGAAGVPIAPVKKNAELLVKLVAVRLGECSEDPWAAAVVAKNACSYSVANEMESGVERRASRLSGPLTRASPCSEDLPKTGASPEWFVYETLRDKCIAAQN